MQIKKWYNSDIVYESRKETLREAVIEAVVVSADLRDADLRDANLGGANLRDPKPRAIDHPKTKYTP